MHPFGGIPICPRCEKAVYAAEQVSGMRSTVATTRDPYTSKDYGPGKIGRNPLRCL